MKTLQVQIRKMTNRMIALLILLAGFVFLTGCQKDELASVNPGINPSADLNKSNALSAAITRTFTVLTIDHAAGRTRLPDYRVEVSNDGSVIFNGRKNTLIAGIRKYRVSAETIRDLMTLFQEYEFNQLDDNASGGSEYLPFVSITFKRALDISSITHLDYNRDQSTILTYLYMRTEGMLGISKFVDQNGNINVATLIADQQK